MKMAPRPMAPAKKDADDGVAGQSRFFLHKGDQQAHGNAKAYHDEQ